MSFIVGAYTRIRTSDEQDPSIQTIKRGRQRSTFNPASTTNWFLPVNRARPPHHSTSVLPRPIPPHQPTIPAKLEDRSIFASRLDAPLNFDTCTILYPAFRFFNALVDAQSTLVARVCTHARVTVRALLDPRREKCGPANRFRLDSPGTSIMPDLREPLAATHVHPEAGRGVNTPGLFRPAFNSALFFPSVASLANREKETDRTEPRARTRVCIARSTERNISR